MPVGFTFPEGELAIGGTFDRVVISSSAPDFAIDNVVATAAPEPSTLLLGLGLTCFGLIARRRFFIARFALGFCRGSKSGGSRVSVAGDNSVDGSSEWRCESVRCGLCAGRSYGGHAAKG